MGVSILTPLKEKSFPHVNPIQLELAELQLVLFRPIGMELWIFLPPKSKRDLKMNNFIIIKFGEVTASELQVFLEAGASDRSKECREILEAQNIYNKEINKPHDFLTYRLTPEQAKWLVHEMYAEADRVSQGVGEAAGRAFERSAEKLRNLIQ
jgi:hypothetical protein